MPDIEIAAALDQVRRSVVRINVRRPKHNLDFYGTGFIVGEITHPGNAPQAVIATAGHLMNEALPNGKWKFDSKDPVEWTLRREIDSREVTFSTPATTMENPRAIFYSEDTRLDLGMLFAEAKTKTGESFLDLAGDGTALKTGIPVVPGHEGYDSGSRIAWGGYAGMLRKPLGEVPFCYYEGVISARVAIEKDYPIYVIDGHNTRGVSGGPVWVWSDDRKRVEFIGVVVSYSQTDLPGFVFATPLHVLRIYLQANWKQATLF